MVKFVTVAVLAGAALGLCYDDAIEDAEKARRGEAVLTQGSIRGVRTTPEIGTAAVSFFFAWIGLLSLHRITGMCGRVLWLPLALATFAALTTSLILVALEFGTLPPPTWHLLGIAVAFNVTGGLLAVSMAKHRW